MRAYNAEFVQVFVLAYRELGSRKECVEAYLCLGKLAEAESCNQGAPYSAVIPCMRGQVP